GHVGDIMQESAQAAYSYIKSQASELKINPKIFEKTDVHIHVPEGSIPKDGPSAGITMATAMASALTKRPVRKDVGMSGEITLRGRVIPIGGVREKVLAAYRLKLKTVIIPIKNQKDLVEIPRQARESLDIQLVRSMDEVLSTALLPEVKKAVKTSNKSRRKGKPPESSRPSASA
ncbi:MAG: endopeptidase La, partial [Anaerolineales bacterium]|nr:endopeptidase La [Anaerolineales bacterium]